jgi:hypothetical protein
LRALRVVNEERIHASRELQTSGIPRSATDDVNAFVFEMPPIFYFLAAESEYLEIIFLSLESDG